MSNRDRLRIAQITDCHLLAEEEARMYGLDTHATLCAVLAEVVAWGPDLVLVTGDLADLGEPKAYQRLRELLLGLDLPVLVIPGNHDDPSVMRQNLLGDAIQWKERWAGSGWRLELLDSHVPDRPGGRLSDPVLSELDSGLGAHPDLPTLVFVHHPPFAVGSPWIDCMGLEEGDTLLTLLQRHAQVQAVVAGHVHQPFDAQLGGLRLLTTPSTCSQALPDQDTWVSDTKGPGFRWFELSAEGMKTGVLRAEGPPERWSQGGF